MGECDSHDPVRRLFRPAACIDRRVRRLPTRPVGDPARIGVARSDSPTTWVAARSSTARSRGARIAAGAPRWRRVPGRQRTLAERTTPDQHTQWRGGRSPVLGRLDQDLAQRRPVAVLLRRRDAPHRPRRWPGHARPAATTTGRGAHRESASQLRPTQAGNRRPTANASSSAALSGPSETIDHGHGPADADEVRGHLHGRRTTAQSMDTRVESQVHQRSPLTGRPRTGTSRSGRRCSSAPLPRRRSSRRAPRSAEPGVSTVYSWYVPRGRAGSSPSRFWNTTPSWLYGNGPPDAMSARVARASGGSWPTRDRCRPRNPSGTAAAPVACGVAAASPPGPVPVGDQPGRPHPPSSDDQQQRERQQDRSGHRGRLPAAVRLASRRRPLRA